MRGSCMNLSSASVAQAKQASQSSPKKKEGEASQRTLKIAGMYARKAIGHSESDAQMNVSRRFAL